MGSWEQARSFSKCSCVSPDSPCQLCVLSPLTCSTLVPLSPPSFSELELETVPGTSPLSSGLSPKDLCPTYPWIHLSKAGAPLSAPTSHPVVLKQAQPALAAFRELLFSEHSALKIALAPFLLFFLPRASIRAGLEKTQNLLSSMIGGTTDAEGDASIVGWHRIVPKSWLCTDS